MIDCKVLTKDGYKYEQAYTPSEYCLAWLNDSNVDKGFCEYFGTFDIETTTIDKTCAFMYCWQFCINGDVIIGRTWDEYVEFVERIDRYMPTDCKMVIYVHNLSYEFFYMYDFIHFKEIFAVGSRAVLSARNDRFEYRCSYKLSNMSLEKFIENTPNTYHLKGVDDLDYKKIRTPKTVLTPLEWGYCYNDVLGLYECIYEYLKYDTLKSIPLTSTGFVRRDCRNAMRYNTANRKNFLRTRLWFDVYKQCIETFRGGNTASNRYHVCLIHNDVGSYDLSSSYPFQMVTRDFPMSQFMKCTIKNIEHLNRLNSEYCTIGLYHFKNVTLDDKVPIPYIPFSKCTKISNGTYYNGRVLSADSISIYLTNIDFEIIKRQYYYTSVRVNKFYFSRKGKLPKELIEQIMHYYKDKTALKDVEGKEYEYGKQKNKLNAIYGMGVSRLVHDTYTFDNDIGAFIIDTDIDSKDELERYYKNRNNFLPYQWGVFVTAYARLMLQDGIDSVGMDVVYCDTDSVKFINNHDTDFENLNREILKHNVYETDKDGNKIYMGVWDKEPSYKEFITLGAKKYAYKYYDDTLGVTVSGLNKKKGAKELENTGGLESFKKGKKFLDSGRTSVYYNRCKPHMLLINGDEFTSASNVAFIDDSYTLGITDSMEEFINRLIREGFNGEHCNNDK